MRPILKMLLYSAFLLIVNDNAVFAQMYDSSINTLADRFAEEKIYTQFDKETYNAGETIWFKSYLYSKMQPSTNSTLLYAELIDAAGNVVDQKKYPVVLSSGAGNFDIPASLPSQKMLFRCYTNWMKNFDSVFYFSKMISILGVEPQAKGRAAGNVPAQTYTLQFFPEGGDMVDGLEGVVAFKCTDGYGMPQAVTGFIKKSTDSSKIRFASTHDGMGLFKLTPKAHSIYQAVWKDVDGKEHTTLLPSSKNNGIAFSITGSKDNRQFVVQRPPNAPNNFKTLHLIGIFAQQIVTQSTIRLSEQARAGGRLVFKDLPTGILQLTLFSADWLPLAERILFIKNNEFKQDVDIKFFEKNISPRGKNLLVVDVDDSVPINASMSITDGLIERSSTDNIYTRLLLTADLKGVVANPNYYFEEDNELVDKNLDLVMLTNGWRRYHWSELLKGRYPHLSNNKTADVLKLNAKLYGLQPGQKLAADEELIVIMKPATGNQQVITMPKVGKDVFEKKDILYFDTLKLYYQFSKEKNLSAQVKIKFTNGLSNGSPISKNELSTKPFYTERPIANRALLFNAETQKLNLANPSAKNLTAVTVKTKTKSFIDKLDEKYTSGLFSNTDGVRFDLVSDPLAPSYPDVFTYLQGKVAGLSISTNGQTPSLSWRGGSPALFLNEFQTDVEQIKNISMSDVAFIKVLRPPFVGAPGGGDGGAIAVYTRKGDDVKTVSDGKGLNQDFIVGYQALKEFYSPDYSNLEETYKKDIRSTIYWNPFITTDSKHRQVKINFYNNDISNSLHIIMEGVNADGKLIRVDKIIR